MSSREPDTVPSDDPNDGQSDDRGGRYDAEPAAQPPTEEPSTDEPSTDVPLTAAAPAANDTPIGAKVAHYRLQALAAQGGMGSVYSAIDETLGRRVALKVLEEQFQADRLIQEARHVSKLNHPGIAGVYQAGLDEESGVAFIAFEWVDGDPLRHQLRAGPITLERFDRYAKDIAAAVAHAHAEGLIHGDLKADNVVVNSEDRLKLLDFGLSAPAEQIDDGDLWGTPAYMPLELYSGSPRNEASDLFALGVLLFEMATGSLPFGGGDGDDRGVRKLLQTREIPDPRELRPELPTVWADVIRQLLQFDPKDRGPNAAEIERIARLRLRGDTRSAWRWGLPLIVVLLAAGAWWSRELWWPAAVGRESPVVEVQQREVIYRVGRWVDMESGEKSAESELGRDLLTLFLNGDDPGSALLLAHEHADARGILAENEVVVDGRWGRVDGQWVATWTWGAAGAAASPGTVGAPRGSAAEGGGDGADSRGAAEYLRVEADQPVPLARELARRLLVETQQRRPLQRVADTLTLREQALVLFLEGIRKVPSGDLLQARDLFARARREAGSFPEATAWEACLCLVADELSEATRIMSTHMRISSLPGRVLVDFIGVPLRRDSRWSASHRLARWVDLVLAWRDPRTPETQLLDELRSHGDGPFRVFPEMSARLALLRGDAVAATDALHRMKSLSCEPWRIQVLQRWLAHVEGRAREGDDALEEWFLDHGGEPGMFLAVPLALYDNNRRSALKRVRRLDATLPQARQVMALTLAVTGEGDAAAAIRSVTSETDPGLAERIRAALLVLDGDTPGARDALKRALEIDPQRPEPAFLLRYLDAGPYALEFAHSTETPDSRFIRWQREFHTLARARLSLESGNASEAQALLGERQWVTPDLQIRDWPELVFLRWLESIRVVQELGDRERAEGEFEQFREWWPTDRAPQARISLEAAEVEALLGT